MHVGIVGYWFNRGTATIGRFLRSTLDGQGHRTAVLARRTKDNFPKPNFVAADDVWAQPRVTAAAGFDVGTDELLDWAERNSLDAAFFSQVYDFDAIAALRATGVATIGHFVWEAFRSEDVAPAARAFDTIYSLTACEQARYRTLGIDSPLVPWGCHPEMAEIPRKRDGERITFFFPGGYMSKRKPTNTTLRAFARVRDPRARLVIKVQDFQRGSEPLDEASAADPRIELITGDVAQRAYYELFASADVCLAPSRWEGLGVHLYEAIAFGMPIITNDDPPMNELVLPERNGVLVSSEQVAIPTPSGVPAFEPDEDELADAIERLLDAGLRARLSAGADAMADVLRWDRTAEAYAEVLAAAVRT